MEYERLTKTNANYEEFIERVTGNKMSYLEYTMKAQKGEKVEMSLATLLYMVKMHQRLAELEDKIEQGTLIELPCKVGDTIYLIFEERWSVGKKETYLYIRKTKLTYGNMERVIKEYGEFVFLTREEAEKRLKELQNGY